ncbi:hypothetical protein AAFF_G00295100 [Aldrovandia affinis]|uniref:Uncharacterized protein n=1 Tax=Aldrovandia affinis TaxID=143900 RepID=A0AAD7W156_9TELE|nr:hypothetical protein AAFF_G00295100 [Aldrovandia affinis]
MMSVSGHIRLSEENDRPDIIRKRGTFRPRGQEPRGETRRSETTTGRSWPSGLPCTVLIGSHRPPPTQSLDDMNEMHHRDIVTRWNNICKHPWPEEGQHAVDLRGTMTSIRE